MAKAKVGPAGIEFIQGALKRPKKQNGHNHGNYLIATHRVAATTNPNCQRLYAFDANRYERTAPVTANERLARNLFKARRQWIYDREASVEHMSSDQQAFLAQKDSANGAKTLKAYYWKLAIAAVTEQTLNG